MDLSSYFVMGLALAAGGFVKGATGMGLPLIALPVITAVFGIQHAVSLMVLPLIATNALQVWRFREARGEPGQGFLPRFLFAGAVGIVLGTWALTSLPESTLVFSLGVILLAYVVMRLTKPDLVVSLAAGRRYGPIAGCGAGILQGATGISAPIGVTFIHSMGFDRAGHVFAVSAMFLVFALTQLPALVVAGVFEVQYLVEGLLALVPILIFMPIGQALAGKLSRKAFDRMILVFLAAIGLKMVLGL